MNRYGIFTLSALLAVTAFAAKVEIGTQGESLFVDGEVSTNVSFNIHRNDTKLLEVKIAAAMTADASVSMAFGHDADADGELAAEETELVLGMSGERCFIEDVASGKRYYDWVACRTGGESYLKFSASNDRNFTPRSVSISCERGELFSELGAQPWMFRRNWNLLKVTRRGIAAVDEVCEVDNRYRAMMLLFR